MTREELKVLQNLPLDLKIEKSKLRINEFISRYGKDSVYISFSGGKDSTVLLDLIRKNYPDVLAVYCDTGLEYPEIKEFVKTIDNVTILKPEMNFKQVIKTHGYPLISKESAKNIYYARRSLEKGDMQKYRRYADGERIGKDGKPYTFNALSKLSKKILNSDIKVSWKCCDIMKKNPAKNFEKKTGMHPFIGTLATESKLRETEYLKHGCNAFTSARPLSTPLGFWTEQDILHYIKQNNLQIAPVYGEVVEENGMYKITGLQRTGCCYCLFGLHREKEPNRIQKLKTTHPKIWEYCLRDLEDGGLGLKKVLDFMEIPYE